MQGQFFISLLVCLRHVFSLFLHSPADDHLFCQIPSCFSKNGRLQLESNSLSLNSWRLESLSKTYFFGFYVSQETWMLLLSCCYVVVSNQVLIILKREREQPNGVICGTSRAEERSHLYQKWRNRKLLERNEEMKKFSIFSVILLDFLFSHLNIV